MKNIHYRTVALVAILVIVIGAYAERARLTDFVYLLRQSRLPEEIKFDTYNPAIPENKNALGSTSPTGTINKRAFKTSAPDINLAVPFTSQAPDAVWDEIHEETCEEASELMVDAYFNGKKFTPESADAALLALNEWEEKNIGEYMNTNVEQVAEVLIKYFRFQNVSIRKIASQEEFLNTIVASLNDDKLIIMPAAGRLLGNPNFTAPGPLYHMLVIKGYTKNKDIITNDPGTRRGHNYVYTLETLYTALHDWNNGDTEHGEKVIVIVGE